MAFGNAWMGSQSWVKKYEPRKVEEIVGQSRAMADFERYLAGFKNQKKKGVILVGPVGCGKSCAVTVLAASRDAEIIEVNASDSRNAQEIESRIGEACRQQSLFFRQKIILVDEIDGIAGQQDRGGIASLARIIEASPFPVVMTANDIDDTKFSPLKKAAVKISFDPISAEAITGVLERVCEGEALRAEPLALSSLAYRCQGDLRSAINDLQAIAQHSGAVTRDEVSKSDSRNKVERMQDALIRIFKVADAAIAGSAFDAVGEDMDECLLWIEENLPREYGDPHALARACNWLSRADVFRGRIRRWQHWRFLVFVNALMTAGVSSAKEKRKQGLVQYERSRRLLSIYLMNLRLARKKAVAKKIAQKSHCSMKRTMQDTMPFVRVACAHNPHWVHALGAWCGFDDEESAWLAGK